MTLGELMKALKKLVSDGARLDSPVIVEGHDEEDRFIQASVSDVKTESRCEDDGEAAGIYLGLEEITIDD
jgi:hypothetical protein